MPSMKSLRLLSYEESHSIRTTYREICHLGTNFKAGQADVRTDDTLNLHPNEAGTKSTVHLTIC